MLILKRLFINNSDRESFMGMEMIHLSFHCSAIALAQNLNISKSESDFKIEKSAQSEKLSNSIESTKASNVSKISYNFLIYILGKFANVKFRLTLSLENGFFSFEVDSSKYQ